MRLLYSSGKRIHRKMAAHHTWKMPNHKRIYFCLGLLNTYKYFPVHTEMQ